MTRLAGTPPIQRGFEPTTLSNFGPYRTRSALAEPS